MPVVGAASGSTADMLTTAIVISGVKGADSRYYLLGEIAFLIGGGNLSIHEVASIGRLIGIPYRAGSYVSAIPLGLMNTCRELSPLIRSPLWRGTHLHDRTEALELNYGRVEHVSQALDVQAPPSWTGLSLAFKIGAEINT